VIISRVHRSYSNAIVCSCDALGLLNEVLSVLSIAMLLRHRQKLYEEPVICTLAPKAANLIAVLIGQQHGHWSDARIACPADVVVAQRGENRVAVCVGWLFWYG
jgi:hypothetical protein